MKIKIIISAIIVIVLLAGFAAIKGWYAGMPSLLTTQFLPVAEMKTATKLPKAKVAVKEIVTIEKKEAAKKLALPETIVKDDAEQVVATAEIPPYEGKTDAIAVMNTVTGEAEIIAKQQPVPLFGLENKKAIGLRYGYSVRAKSDIQNGMQVDIYGRWDFLRIGNVHTGIYGEINSAGDGKAMLNIEYRW